MKIKTYKYYGWALSRIIYYGIDSIIYSDCAGDIKRREFERDDEDLTVEIVDLKSFKTCQFRFKNISSFLVVEAPEQTRTDHFKYEMALDEISIFVTGTEPKIITF